MLVLRAKGDKWEIELVQYGVWELWWLDFFHFSSNLVFAGAMGPSGDTWRFLEELLSLQPD